MLHVCLAEMWRCGSLGLFPPIASLTKPSTLTRTMPNSPKKVQTTSELNKPLYFCKPQCPVILFKGFRLCLHSAVSYPVLLLWLWLQLTSHKRARNGSLYASCLGPNLLIFFGRFPTCVTSVAFGKCIQLVLEKTTFFVRHHSGGFYKSRSWQSCLDSGASGLLTLLRIVLFSFRVYQGVYPVRVQLVIIP